MFAAIHATPGDSEKLLKLAQEFSPLVEQTAADTVALDADGLERIHGLPQQIAAALARRAAERGIQASVAIAANLDTAVHAARGFAGVSVIPYGDEAKYLGSLPLTLLGPTPEMQETLERWGIRRFRDLAALPELGLAERLGPEGLAFAQAGARCGRPAAGSGCGAAPFCRRGGTGISGGVAGAVAVRAGAVVAAACARGWFRTAWPPMNCGLRLKLENRGEHTRALRFPVPMLDTKAFLKLLDLDLGAHPPPSPVVKVWLEAEPAKPRAAQTGLFIPLSPEPEKLELTLARLKSLVGETNVGSPRLLDTHRPGAFQMLARPFAPSPHRPLARVSPLRAIRPPRAARVQMASGQPVHVQAEGVRGHVTSAAGPWRTSGDWWTADPWARDEWDVALSDGALYRIYSEQGRWFVEGSYD